MKIRVAQVKVVPIKGALEANHRRLMAVLAEIASHRPDVVVTPECFLDGYIATEKEVTRQNIGQYAIDPGASAYIREAADWAARQRSWLILGCARAVPGGVTNSALILDRAGELSGIYDKVHLQRHDLKYLPGTALPVFPSDFGPFGVMICADRRWPETVRTLVLKGARVIFNPTYGFHNEKNLMMMCTRSYESEVWIAFTHPAQALVTGPEGEIVRNEILPEVAFAVSEIDLAAVDMVRAGESSHLKARRPELYG
jgi:predicted amidohydrolase